MDLRPLTRIARKAPNNPITRCVRMDHDSDGSIVAFEASDMELSLRLEKPGAKISGSFLCPLTKELSAAKGINLDTARIVYDTGSPLGKLVTLGSTVSAGSPDEWNQRDGHVEPSAIYMEAAELARMFREACYCAPNDDSRYGLNGAHIERIDSSTIRVVCTDGNRLAWTEASYEGEEAHPMRHMLHDPRLLQVAGSVIVGAACLSWSEGSRTAQTTGTDKNGWTVSLVSRLRDGEFPNYRAVMPSKSIGNATVSIADLAGALAIVKPYAIDQATTVDALIEDRALAMYARGIDVGEVATRIGAGVDMPSKVRSYAFSCCYMAQLVKAWPDDSIRFEFSSTLGPIVAYSEDSRNAAIIMPIRQDGATKIPAGTATYEATVKAKRKAPVKRKAAPKRKAAVKAAVKRKAAVKAKPEAKPEVKPISAPCPDCSELRQRLYTERDDHAAALERSKAVLSVATGKMHDRIVSLERGLKQASKDRDANRRLYEDMVSSSARAYEALRVERDQLAEKASGYQTLTDRIAQLEKDSEYHVRTIVESAKRAESLETDRELWKSEAKRLSLERSEAQRKVEALEARIAQLETAPPMPVNVNEPTTVNEPEILECEEPEAITVPRLVIAGGNLARSPSPIADPYRYAGQALQAGNLSPMLEARAQLPDTMRAGIYRRALDRAIEARQAS